MDASYASLEEIPALLLGQSPWDQVTRWWQWPFRSGALPLAIMKFILAKGFILTLVGGGMRSLLTDPTSPLDKVLDFEIRHPAIEEQAWPPALRALMQEVATHFAPVVWHEHLYLSFTLTAAAGQTPFWQMDFTSPRLEHHTAVGRRGFTAQYLANLPYAQAWQRRDFTINAMGVECCMKHPSPAEGPQELRPSFRLIDPFQGLRDWHNKQLNIISEDFYQDPVRFLRFGRWWEQGWRPGARSLAVGRMDLTSLSKFLLGREALKGNFFGTMATFKDLGQSWQVKWPTWPIFTWPWEKWHAAAQAAGIKISQVATAAQFLAKVDPAQAAEFARFWELPAAGNGLGHGLLK